MRLKVTFELVEEPRDEKNPRQVYLQGTFRHLGLAEYFALRTEHMHSWSIEIANADKIRQIDAWLQPH